MTVETAVAQEPGGTAGAPSTGFPASEDVIASRAGDVLIKSTLLKVCTRFQQD